MLEPIKNSRRTVFLLSLGASIEYFDFIVYGMMAPYLGALFFPQDDPFVSSLMAFASFVIGYLARPLGGILFGIIADRKGRKRILIIQTLFVCFSTLGIGLLPSYESAGLMGTVLLVSLRIIQGLAFGAEVPAVITIVKESCSKPAFSFSFAVSSMGFGAISASAMLYWLTHTFTHQEMVAFAWRFPFFLGGVLGIIALFMRRYLDETPSFVAQQAQLIGKKLQGNAMASVKSTVLTEIISSFKKFFSLPFREARELQRKIFAGMMLCAFSSCLIITNIFFPSFFNTYYGCALSDVYLATSISLAFGAFCAPLIGYASECMNKTYMVFCAFLLFIGIVIVFHRFTTLKTLASLLIFLSFYQLVISTLMICLMPILAEIFKTSERFASVAVCYNIVYSLMAASFVFVCYMVRQTNFPFLLFIFCIICSIITLVGCLNVQKNVQKSENKDGEKLKG